MQHIEEVEGVEPERNQAQGEMAIEERCDTAVPEG